MTALGAGKEKKRKRGKEEKRKRGKEKYKSEQ
jgi:hypothetical protein